ncbi:hypothetical protein ACSV9I_04800 [Rhizobium sp. G187]|uniref:hypothetical protein n=1 Tax=Rhizobium sp. G187 TaxID=3451352 RepID=UPI003EE803C8
MRRSFRYHPGMAEDAENKGIAPDDTAQVGAGSSGEGNLTDRGARGLSEAEQRRRIRAAEKLRENLARRKQQSRARRAGRAEDGEGLPAARPSAGLATETETPAVEASQPSKQQPAAGTLSAGMGVDEPVVAISAANSSKPGD